MTRERGRTTAGLIFLALLLYPGIALATTVTGSTLIVTSGQLAADEEYYISDMCGRVAGIGFDILGCGIINYGTQELLGTQGGTSIDAYGQTINGIPYLSPAIVEPRNLVIRFYHDPISPAFFQSRSSNPVSEPFSMTGILTLLEPATNNLVVFDLVGWGNLDVFYRDSPRSGFPFLRVEYNFAAAPVPEPSSVFMFGVGLLGLVCLQLRHAQRRP